ncbi:MAG: hypothetical protein LHV68_05065 [Elusimicrobia bacterium]|nr:hypothetical protein [Candidatus Liberimonas magnetica]
MSKNKQLCVCFLSIIFLLTGCAQNKQKERILSLVSNGKYQEAVNEYTILLSMRKGKDDKEVLKTICEGVLKNDKGREYILYLIRTKGIVAKDIYINYVKNAYREDDTLLMEEISKFKIPEITSWFLNNYKKDGNWKMLKYLLISDDKKGRDILAETILHDYQHYYQIVQANTKELLTTDMSNNRNFYAFEESLINHINEASFKCAYYVYLAGYIKDQKCQKIIERIYQESESIHEQFKMVDNRLKKKELSNLFYRSYPSDSIDKLKDLKYVAALTLLKMEDKTVVPVVKENIIYISKRIDIDYNPYININNSASPLSYCELLMLTKRDGEDNPEGYKIFDDLLEEYNKEHDNVSSYKIVEYAKIMKRFNVEYGQNKINSITINVAKSIVENPDKSSYEDVMNLYYIFMFKDHKIQGLTIGMKDKLVYVFRKNMFSQDYISIDKWLFLSLLLSE